jgi:general secretion pathway protein J
VAERRPRARWSGGFTLLEMLIVLAVLGLIMVALVGGLRFGTRAWETMDRRQGAATEVDAVQSLFRQFLHAMQPMPLIGLGQEKAAYFVDGGVSNMSMVTDMPEAVGGGEHYDVTLALAPPGRLVVRWRLHVRKTDLSDATVYRETELLTGVEELRLRYLAAGTTGDDPDRWTETWPQQGALPALVKIHLRFAKGDNRRWVDVLAAPLVNAQ